MGIVARRVERGPGWREIGVMSELLTSAGRVERRRQIKCEIQRKGNINLKSNCEMISE